MIKIIISGCNGHMGKAVAAMAKDDPDIFVIAGFDINPGKSEDFPVFTDPVGFIGEANAVIDFSNPSALDALLAYGISKNTPLVLCTTGYTSEQITSIKKASEQIPIFRSGNMSLGINLLADLVRRACSILGDDYDIEIVERHHRRKVDAPSGTALMLADAVSSALHYNPEYVYERQGRRKAREAFEIGISTVRGGTIVGEHEVIFAGPDEIIELRHSAASRDVFANGAIMAVKFISEVGRPGIYDMSHVLVHR
jgi:4-hydroxy-tetrahydrodipicolinate reductase